jgi:hypothetical protein
MTESAPAAKIAAVGQPCGQDSGDAHVEHVRSECQNTAILEHERLNGQNGGHDDRSRGRAERDGQQRPAHQVRAGAGGDREVDHLGGEDEGSHDAQQGRARLFQFAPRAACEHGDSRQPGDIQGQPDGRGKESVGNVHRIPR